MASPDRPKAAPGQMWRQSPSDDERSPLPLRKERSLSPDEPPFDRNQGEVRRVRVKPEEVLPLAKSLSPVPLAKQQSSDDDDHSDGSDDEMKKKKKKKKEKKNKKHKKHKKHKKKKKLEKDGEVILGRNLLFRICMVNLTYHFAGIRQ
jgi:serine/arginine repetitive matrix protein 1